MAGLKDTASLIVERLQEAGYEFRFAGLDDALTALVADRS